MSISTGTRVGPYEIQAPLGAGGMGEVYRARDTKLGRDVAIKTLPDLFVNHPERVARFEREAQLLAALNHPHIAGIYGLEQSAGAQFLVLELVEGESLAQRLAQGPLTIPDTMSIARQLVDALEAAHEKGIIHRDLKPANIMLTAEGQVKVLDFGLAKALEPEHQPNPSLSPTLTFGATQAGVILGTAAYMSPEQAKGRVADKRSDVWAFGCVLYEMLSGRRAFEGEDVSDTLAGVLRGEPDWTALPSDVAPGIRALVKRCLEKDRRARIPDISVVRFLMNEAASALPGEVAVQPVKLPRRRLFSIATTGVVAGAVLAIAILWVWQRWAPKPARQPMRFAIVPPAARPLSMNATDRAIAISADGTHLVYVGRGGGQTHLMVRAIDRLEAVPLAGIANPRVPFLSPDGRWIGFFSAGELRKVSITGGPSIPLCRITGGPRGASWGPDDTIIFATNDPGTGLISVAAGGGEPRVLTKPDLAKGEQDHLFPSLLPGGRAVLFTIGAAAQIENAQVAVLDLGTAQPKTLIRGGSHAEYVETGHLVYAVAGSLRAVRFDPGRLEVLSDPVPVAEQVLTLTATGAANYTVSRNGTLVYVPGTAGQAGGPRSLVWVNRQGREEPIGAPPRAYVNARLSPDGTRAALDVRDQEQDIWIWDFARGTLDRLTRDPGVDASPVWTPDGRRVIFQSARAGAPNLFWQQADVTGSAERLTTSPNLQVPHAVSPDAARIVLMEVAPKTGPDLLVLPLGGQPRAEPVLQGSFAETNSDLSPDGRWLAYQSNESGQPQIYVRPFPNVDAGRSQISTNGGSRPVWARNGRELFYLDASGALTTVQVRTTPTFSPGNPKKVFDTRYFAEAPGRAYDVSRDGQRFLMIKDTLAADANATPASVVVVLNWFEELKGRVPTR